MQVKGSRPACVEVRDTACEFPSISFHRPAAGGLILSHSDVIDTELQPDNHHTRLSCHILINISPQRVTLSHPVELLDADK